jgi:predicted nucleotidyltransferase
MRRAPTAISISSSKPGSKRLLSFPAGLVADLEEALGRRVDIVEDEALHHLLRDRIRAEAVPL